MMPRPIGVEAAAVAVGFWWLFALWLFFVGAVAAVVDESARLRLRVPPGVPVVDAAALDSLEEAEDLDFVPTTRSSFSFFSGGILGEPFFVCGSSTAAIAGETAEVEVASGESIRCFFLWKSFAVGGGGGVGCGCAAMCPFSGFGVSRSLSLLEMNSGHRGAGSISTSSGSTTALGVSFLLWDLLATITGVVVEESAGVRVGAAAAVEGVGKWEVMCSGEAEAVAAIGWIWGCRMAGWPRSGEFVAEAVGVCAVLSIRWLR